MRLYGKRSVKSVFRESNGLTRRETRREMRKLIREDHTVLEKWNEIRRVRRWSNLSTEYLFSQVAPCRGTPQRSPSRFTLSSLPPLLLHYICGYDTSTEIFLSLRVVNKHFYKVISSVPETGFFGCGNSKMGTFGSASTVDETKFILPFQIKASVFYANTKLYAPPSQIRTGNVLTFTDYFINSLPYIKNLTVVPQGGRQVQRFRDFLYYMTIQRLGNIRYLNIQGNRADVSPELVEFIKSLKKLEILDVSRCRARFDWKQFSNTNVRKIFVSPQTHASLTENEVKRKFPKLEILYSYDYVRIKSSRREYVYHWMDDISKDFWARRRIR